MLYAFGSILFEVYPVNVYEVDGQSDGGLVDKPVLGRRPPVECVGDGQETMRLAVKLFPEKLGGYGSISDLQAMRAAGVPQPLARGDGTWFGWWWVDKMSVKETRLGPNGVGREIDVDLTLRHGDPPDAASALTSVLELFQ